MMIKTDDQRKAYIDALVKIEVNFAKSNACEWPSLFSNLIEPRKKDFPSAIAFYDSLSNEEIEKRQEIHSWEAGAWNLYEDLMGCSLTPLCKSIDPCLWAKKEIFNIELLLNEGKNQLMTTKDYSDEYLEEIPGMFNKLLCGDWDNFILIDELKLFREADSKYSEENKIDPFNLEGIDFIVLYSSPRKEQFLNIFYFIAKEIQALLWYRNFLREIMSNGITFYNENVSDDIDQNKPRKKYIDIKKLKRVSNGSEAIIASYNKFCDEKNRFPEWSELMLYMSKTPPQGFKIEASFKGNSVSEILIEGVERPLDRDAFRKRYNRYFPKADTKPDIKQ